MAGDKKGTILSVTDGGVSGEHSAPNPLQVLVAPSTADQFNAVSLPPRAIACWRTDDNRFAFDSSFPGADLSFTREDPCQATAEGKRPDDIRTELCELVKRINEHPGCVLSVFGHADPVGDDNYNKKLSGRRAMVIYGLLIFKRDPDKAANLWKQVASEESWGKDHREMMQAFTSSPAGTSMNQMIKPYMKKLCPPELDLDPKERFLARAKDSGGKGDYQGCSEFNPILIFSQEDQDRFDKAQKGNSERDKLDIKDRNTRNAPNRRVLVFLFEEGTQITPSKWPCPRATGGITECKQRFFADGEDRRSRRLPDKPRKFGDTLDTFACRFYQRLSQNSPCERLLRTFRIRLFDRQAQAIPGAPFATVIAGVESQRGHADSNGDFILTEVEAPSIVTVRWSRRDEQRKPPPGSRDLSPSDEDSLRAAGATEEEIERMKEDPPLDFFEFENDVVVDIPSEPTDADEVTATQVPPEDRRRLHNMGYSTEEEAEANLKAFQRDCETGTGKAVDDVFAELRKRHEDCDPPPRNSKA